MIIIVLQNFLLTDKGSLSKRLLYQKGCSISVHHRNPWVNNIGSSSIEGWLSEVSEVLSSNSIQSDRLQLCTIVGCSSKPHRSKLKNTQCSSRACPADYRIAKDQTLCFDTFWLRWYHRMIRFQAFKCGECPLMKSFRRSGSCLQMANKKRGKWLRSCPKVKPFKTNDISTGLLSCWFCDSSESFYREVRLPWQPSNWSE